MNSQQQHEDPASDAAARAAQLAAMALSIAEGVARLRAERLAGRAADDERQAGALRAQHRADQAAALLDGRGSARPGLRTAADPVTHRDIRTTTPTTSSLNAVGTQAHVGSHMGSADASLDPVGGPGRTRLSIICTPQGLRDQAFPVDVPAAMVTAPQAARDALQTARNPQAGQGKPRLSAVPGHGSGPSRRGGAR